MDLLDRIMDYLESNLTLFAVFKQDILSDDDASLAIRLAPSSPSERFYDRSKENIISFQILSKHTNQLLALQTLYEISNSLEDLVDLSSQDGSYIFSKIELYTNPTWVSKTDHNSHIYTALFNAYIFQ